MTHKILVTGTDTDIGKTIFSAGLVAALHAHYWKPIQSGLEGGGDKETVRELSGAEPDKILDEAYRLATPCSPHKSAEIDGVTIDPAKLTPPTLRPDDTLVIEAAGGLLVPITNNILQVDVFANWNIPTILCARTALGTINHTLMSLEILKARAIPCLGVAFIGEAEPTAEAAITSFSKTNHLGRLAHCPSLTPRSLSAAFQSGIDIAAITAGLIEEAALK